MMFKCKEMIQRTFQYSGHLCWGREGGGGGGGRTRIGSARIHRQVVILRVEGGAQCLLYYTA